MLGKLLVLGLSVLLLSGLTVSEVYLNVSPNRLEFFIRETLTLTCLEDGQPAVGWTVMKHSGGHNLCRPGLRDFGTKNGSSVILSDLGNKDITYYWCEDRDGQRSEHVPIQIEDHVILDIPAHPVIIGSNLTLHCIMRNGSTVAAYFFINESLVGSGPEPQPQTELTIRNVQKSDEGSYSCKAVTYGRSPRSWLRVRDPPTPPTPPPAPIHLRVSVNVSPNLQQFFTNGPYISVTCVEDGQTVDEWMVKRTIENQTLECGGFCSGFDRFIVSYCSLAYYLNFTGVYWCESKSGLKTDQVTITLTEKDLILQIPALPVVTGSDVTLHCKNRKDGVVSASFFKNGSLIGDKVQELTISKIQQSDEGLYSCSTDEFGSSPQSLLRVRDLPTTSPEKTL
ncbi:Fc receptor-like protein 5 [Channa argus]|uniref:Fc receptor-like protein 5 n=1 Tax=Channa argus TaxID=215402 RepID=A0A6G1Q7V6_CHAAH|nr:Fc receptor-like protein 5 [Channa argus]